MRSKWNPKRKWPGLLTICAAFWFLGLTVITQSVLSYWVPAETAGGVRWLLLAHFWGVEFAGAIFACWLGRYNPRRGFRAWIILQLILWQLLITFIVAREVYPRRLETFEGTIPMTEDGIPKP